MPSQPLSLKPSALTMVTSFLLTVVEWHLLARDLPSRGLPSFLLGNKMTGSVKAVFYDVFVCRTSRHHCSLSSPTVIRERRFMSAV